MPTTPPRWPRRRGCARRSAAATRRSTGTSTSPSAPAPRRRTGEVDGTELLVRAGLALDAARAAGGARSHAFERALLEAAVERGRLADELVAALGRGQLVAALPADRGARRRRASPPWRRSCAGSTPSTGCCRRPASCRTSRTRRSSSSGPAGAPAGLPRRRRLARPPPEHADLGVTVNVAARQLAEDGLVDDVRDALAAAGLPPRALTIEITETAAMRDAPPPATACGPCARSACAWPSTTSAPATPRSATCGASTSTC